MLNEFLYAVLEPLAFFGGVVYAFRLVGESVGYFLTKRLDRQEKEID
jgi:hypothetical protein